MQKNKRTFKTGIDTNKIIFFYFRLAIVYPQLYEFPIDRLTSFTETEHELMHQLRILNRWNFQLIPPDIKYDPTEAPSRRNNDLV